MKGQVISSNHTIMIDEFQIDLWYNFERTWMEIFVDGNMTIQGNYTPTHKQFNYVNLMEVATTALSVYKRKLASVESERLKDEEDSKEM